MQEQGSPRRWADSGDERRRAIFDSAVEFGIVATDVAGRITDWNTGAAQIFGWTADEIRDEPADRIFTPEDLAAGQVAREMQQALASGRATDERWHLRRDGSRFWASGEMMPLRGDDGAHLGFVKILRDRTAEHVAAVDRAHQAVLDRQEDERKLQQQAAALRDSEDFARLALQAVGGVGVWTYEVASDRFFCDASVSELYGIDPVEGAAGILRSSFLANVHPDDTAALRATMSGGLVRPGDLELEYRIRHPDGSIKWVLSRGHTYFDAAGHPVRRTGVGVDMTRQRVLEEQLRQSQKLEAIGQLTGGIAHDFNNMLSTISTSIELLRRKMATGTPEELERFLGMASRAVRSAATLTQRLLTFSRKQTLDIHSVDVNRQVNEMADLLRRTLGERVALRFDLAPGVWHANTDAHQLEQSLVNLAINARDAMARGGELTVTTANLTVGAQHTRDGSELKVGEYVAIRVTDTGTGMPADVIQRAFDPFYTTKPLGEGTGLGLSMIYGFAKQSGGRAAIRSQVGQGTTVEILLPRAHEAARELAVAGALAELPRGAGERVLVVEDDADVLAVLMEVLQQHGYSVVSVPEAASALARLAADAGYALLVTDIGLPGMNGRELADRARALLPDIPVLFITGYSGDAVVRGEYLAKGMDLIAKPFEVDALVTKVHAMTRR